MNPIKPICLIFAAMLLVSCNINASESAPTVGDVIKQNPTSEKRARYIARVFDCDERIQFAGAVVQLRDHGKSVEEIREFVANQWVEIEKETAVPYWYKLEFERIINSMVRMKPTDYNQFGLWFATQCVKYGPWLDPAVK